MISFGLFKTKKELVIDNKDLRIDCRKCGEPSISNVSCLRCIGTSIVRFGEPERITLRSGILRRVSDVFCRTSVGKDDRRCRGCVLSRESLEDEKWADLSFDNIDEIMDRLGKVYVDCPESQECIAAAESYFTMLRDRLEALSNEAVVTAYRIVGA